MKKILRLLSIPVALLSFVFLTCYGYNGYYSPMMGRGHLCGMYGMRGPFMGIIWIAFLLLLGFGIYYFFKNKGINTGANETPLDIIKKRYAKGEINKEVYERMKDELK